MKHTLSKLNLILIAVSVIIIVIGFALMAGEPSGEVYNPDIFSFRRITMGPMIDLFGFCSMIVAILFTIFLIWTLFIFITFDVDKMKDDIESKYSTSLLDANNKLMDVFLNNEEQWHLKIEDEVADNLKAAVMKIKIFINILELTYLP